MTSLPHSVGKWFRGENPNRESARASMERAGGNGAGQLGTCPRNSLTTGIRRREVGRFKAAKKGMYC